CLHADVLNQPVQIVVALGRYGAVAKNLGRIPAKRMFTSFGTETVNTVGQGQGLWQSCGHRAQFHGVGTGFEYGKNTARSNLLAQAVQGRFNGGGVMGKVVKNLYTVDGATQFHAAADAGKPR